MADKATEVTTEAKNAFVLYRKQAEQTGTPRSQAEEPTFVAGFMAGYLMGFAEGLDEDVFNRAVGKMLQHDAYTMVVAYKARKFSLKLEPA